MHRHTLALALGLLLAGPVLATPASLNFRNGRLKVGEIWRVNPDTGNGEYFGDGGPVAEARFSPSGLAPDGDGNLYIADAGNGRIRVVRGVLKDL